MRIAVVSLDTRGGVQPYAALALGLRSAGHEVRMVAPDNFVPGLRDRGLTVVPITGSGEDPARGSRAVAELSSLARTRLMRQQAVRTVGRSAQEVLAGCDGVELLTGGVGGMVVGVAVAEKLGVPFLEAHLQPIGPPTSAFPGVLMPHVPSWLGGPGRRASHRLSAIALQVPFRPAVRHARTDVLGLPARPVRPRPGLPVVYGFSPQIVAAPRDWGTERHVTGYWTLPAGDGWTPPPSLEAFLAAGPPPVCVGFGSMATEDPRALTALVLESVRRAAVRAVLLSGWGGLEDLTAPQVGDGDVMVLDEAPHDWLYPRCAAVVHHGGAGTTGAALSAGVPAIVMPFAVDQPFWGARVAALGVGPTPIPRRNLTVDALTAALRATVADRTMQERSAELGARIRAEDGVARAVEQYDAVAARVV